MFSGRRSLEKALCSSYSPGAFTSAKICSSSSSSSPPLQKAVAVDAKSVVTVEFQRQKAKRLQEYFKQKNLEAAAQGPFFGFQPKNEISNGRWAMFGFAVGLLTDYKVCDRLRPCRQC
ncbi:hypothetical protein IGI04_019557 [Brassica rapa subsp. trilocularis]|uniref:Uncharacterized protein n=1 Tax=Brassica rapa subsp. trilocularis TaxID=1813537 RepID=A0ABQ7MG65_BRACM|nr:hypothetical protein IGI04_019557 [Brassica rapa subsp. trilocularis]